MVVFFLLKGAIRSLSDAATRLRVLDALQLAPGRLVHAEIIQQRRELVPVLGPIDIIWTCT